jgi:hypothetical protein
VEIQAVSRIQIAGDSPLFELISIRRVVLALLVGSLLLAGCAKQQVGVDADPAAANTGDEYGYTPLIRASWQGDLTEIDYWLRKGARINQPDHAGVTPIMHAAAQCQINAFRMLEKSGADLTRTDVAKRSVLHHAARGGCRDLLRYLVSNDNVLDGADKFGRTPLMLAADHHQAEAVRVLLDMRAQPDLRDHQGRTPLYHAAAAFDRQAPALKADSTSGTTTNAITTTDTTTEQPPFFQRLKVGAGKAARSTWGWIKRSAKTVGRGIKKGAQASWAYITRPPWKPKNQTKQAKETEFPPPMPMGDEKEGERVISLLLKAGADPKTPDNDGITPADLLKRKNRTAMLSE